MEPENKYLPELMAEKDSLDPSFTHAMQLLTAGCAVISALSIPGERGEQRERISSETMQSLPHMKSWKPLPHMPPDR